MSLIDSDVMYRHLVQGVVDYAIYMLNPDGTVANWNPGAQRAKGYLPKEIIGCHFSCFYTAEDRAAGVPERGLQSAIDTGKFEAEGWRVRKDGTLFWAHVVIDAIHDEEGGLRGFAKVTRDCSERREKERQLELAKSLAERYSKDMEELSGFLEAVIANIPSCVVVLDGISRNVVLANRQAEVILGQERTTLVGKPIPACLPGTLGEIIERLTDQVLKSDSSISEEAEVATARGQRTLRANGLVFRGHDPRTRHVLLIADDVTEERAAAARVRHMAHHDTLTGTPNRRLFRDLLFQELSLYGPNRRTAVFCVDLDRFKNVNDTLGHHIGDGLLRMLTARLGNVLRAQDTLARLGGDEFAALLPDIRDIDELNLVGRDMIQAAQQPFEIDGHTVSITISIGVAIGHAGSASVDQIMRYADLALYEAKRLGKNRVEFFHDQMEVVSRKRREVEMDLRQAIVSRQLSLHYQPIIDGGPEPRVIAREALIRWNHPVRGVVMPLDFIGIAEETGLIHEIGAFVLHEACSEAMTWPDEARVAVNISPTQFSNGALTAVVVSVLEKTGLPACRLELEITESVLLADSNANLAELNALKKMGVKISLDDFGTGYSSLGYLRSFEFDCIKIDRSFTSDIDSSPESLAIVRAINGIGRSLSIPITAEGVETAAQMQRLVGEGCTMFQGFLIGHPSPSTGNAPERL